MRRCFGYLFRIIIILLPMLIFSGFGSCQQSAPLDLDIAGSVEIDFWHYYNSEQKSQLDELITTFCQTTGKETGIVVNTFHKGSSDELAQLLTAQAAAGGANLPDLFSVYPDAAWEINRYDKLLPLNSYLNESELAAFPAEYLLEGRIMGDQNVYLLPLAKASEVIAVNMQLWQKFYADNPRYENAAEIFSSWETIAAAATAYNRWSQGRPMFAVDSLANFIIIGNKQLGVEILSRKGQGGEVNLDRESMYRLWQIYVPSIITGGFSDSDIFVSEQMARGEIAAGLVSTSAGPYLPALSADSGSGESQLQIFAYPVFTDGEPFCVQQGAGLAVARSEDVNREKAAVILLQWLTRPEQNVSFAISSGYLPVTKPALQSQLLQEYLKRLQEAEPEKPGIYLTLHTFLQQMDSHGLYSTPAFSGSLYARNIISSSLLDYAAARRSEYQNNVSAGKNPDLLYDQYINSAAFEAWYSQLLLDIDNIDQVDN